MDAKKKKGGLRQLDLGRYFSIGPAGLAVRNDPPIEAWRQYGLTLGDLHEGAQWGLGDWWNYGEGAYGEEATQEIADLYESESLRNFAWVARKFPADTRAIPLPRGRRVGWASFQAVAALELGDALELLQEAAARGLSRKDLREKVRARNHAARTSERQWPAGRFGLILIDPPWKPDEGLLDPTRAIENQYPTMTIEELVALAPEVEAVAATDCVLASWVVAQKIAEYVALAAAWGFTHKSGAVWVKDTIGMGYWFRGRHELLCLATKGAPATPLEQARPDSVIQEPRRGHSQKPDRQYAMLDVMFPGVPKIELFARECHARPDAWATWGNEEVGPRLRQAEAAEAL